MDGIILFVKGVSTYYLSQYFDVVSVKEALRRNIWRQMPYNVSNVSRAGRGSPVLSRSVAKEPIRVTEGIDGSIRGWIRPANQYGEVQRSGQADQFESA